MVNNVQGYNPYQCYGNSSVGAMPTPGNIDNDPEFESLANALQEAMDAYNADYNAGKTGTSLDHAGLAVLQAVKNMMAYFTSQPTTKDPKAYALYNVLSVEVPLGSPGGLSLAGLANTLGTASQGATLTFFASFKNIYGNSESLFARDESGGANIYDQVYAVNNNTSDSGLSKIKALVQQLQTDINKGNAQGIAADLASLQQDDTLLGLDGWLEGILDEAGANTDGASGSSIASLAAAYQANPNATTLAALQAGLSSDNGAALNDLSFAVNEAISKEGW